MNKYKCKKKFRSIDKDTIVTLHFCGSIVYVINGDKAEVTNQREALKHFDMIEFANKKWS